MKKGIKHQLEAYQLLSQSIQKDAVKNNHRNLLLL